MKRLENRWLLLVVLALLIAPLFLQRATADSERPKPPYPGRMTSEKYMRAGGSTWGHAVPVLTTARPVLTSTGAASTANHPQLFHWGTMVTIVCEGEADWYWTQTTTVTVVAGANAGHLEDANGPDGIAPAFRTYGSISTDQVIWKGAFTAPASVGRRDGFCTGGPEVSNIQNFPCRVDGDCIYASATCDIDGFKKSARITLESFYITKGAFLVGIAEVATECFLRVDR